MGQSLSPEELFEAASAFIEAKRWDEAVNMLQKAILLQPNYSSAYNQRGNVLQCMGRHFDAVLNYGVALGMDPTQAEIYNNRGAALQVLEDYAAAMRDYLKAIEIRPIFAECLTNIGNVQHIVGNLDSAKAYYAKAIEAKPDYVDAHFNLACTDLETGNFEDGWKRYEWRWKTGQVPIPEFQMPVWQGEDLSDKSILIWAEQGLGDALQFIRFVPVIKSMGAKFVGVEVRPPLMRIAQTIEGADKVYGRHSDISEKFDYHIPMMSIPKVLQTKVGTIPCEVPYLSCPDLARQRWKEKLSAYQGTKIGICWAGSPRPFQPAANAVDRRRSTHLQQWSPISSVKGAVYVSLQKEAAAEQGNSPPEGMTLLNWTDELDDLTDTAALISSLDLVITVDTAVVHLAGALAKPVWLLSRHDNCWRWLGRRQYSPWYPTLRQFIQPNPGDWDAVFHEVAAELKKLIPEKSHQTMAA